MHHGKGSTQKKKHSAQKSQEKNKLIKLKDRVSGRMVERKTGEEEAFSTQ